MVYLLRWKAPHFYKLHNVGKHVADRGTQLDGLIGISGVIVKVSVDDVHPHWGLQAQRMF
jgi:hypothetical protein